jgi:hypothetical protein
MMDEFMEGSFQRIGKGTDGREVWRKWVPRICLMTKILVIKSKMIITALQVMLHVSGPKNAFHE